MKPSNPPAAPELVPSGQPFASLPELQRQNAALMRSWRSEFKLKPGDVLGFLGRVKATGQHVASAEERDAALRILSYWASIAVGLHPEAARELSRLELDDFSTSSTNAAAPRAFPGLDGAELCEVAKQLTEKLAPTQVATLSRLLTLLISLPPGAPNAVFRPLQDDHEFVRQSGVGELLKALAENRIIRKEGTPPFWTLTHEALLAGWPLLSNICDERKALRDLASGWESLDRAESALLTRGDELNRAGQFDDLNLIEKEFVANSQKQRNRSLMNVIILLSLAVAFLGFGAVQLSIQKHAILSSEQELKQQYRELQQANIELRQLSQSRQVALSNAYIALEEWKKNLAGRIDEQRDETRFQSIFLSRPNPPLVLHTDSAQQSSIFESSQRLVKVYHSLTNQAALDFRQAPKR